MPKTDDRVMLRKSTKDGTASRVVGPVPRHSFESVWKEKGYVIDEDSTVPAAVASPSTTDDGPPATVTTSTSSTPPKKEA